MPRAPSARASLANAAAAAEVADLLVQPECWPSLRPTLRKLNRSVG